MFRNRVKVCKMCVVTVIAHHLLLLFHNLYFRQEKNAKKSNWKQCSSKCHFINKNKKNQELICLKIILHAFTKYHNLALTKIVKLCMDNFSMLVLMCLCLYHYQHLYCKLAFLILKWVFKQFVWLSKD